MLDVLLNGWVIGIGSSLIVALLLAAAHKICSRDRNGEQASHRIRVAGRGSIRSGKRVISGDLGRGGDRPGEESLHSITAEDNGTIDADEDVVSGDVSAED